MTPDETKTLLTGNFGKKLHKAACSYCHPIFWALRGDSGLLKITANGTAFVLDCGKRPFLVTAAHVYEAYISDLEKFGERVFGSLGSIPFRMEKRLIACLGSKTLDVATFEITPEEITESEKCVLGGSQKSWPPDRVKEGEAVLFAGFPGAERIEDPSELECNFGLYSAINPVSSISERHFGCAFERSEWLDTMGNGFPKEGYDLGGISGCPVLALKESSAGVFSWSLAGPPRQNSCRPDMILNLGAIRKKDGTVRRSIEEQSGGAVAAAGERRSGRGSEGNWSVSADIGTLA